MFNWKKASVASLTTKLPKPDEDDQRVMYNNMEPGRKQNQTYDAHVEQPIIIFTLPSNHVSVNRIKRDSAGAMGIRLKGIP